MKKIITLIATGLAAYFYKQSVDLAKQNEQEKQDHEDYVDNLLDEIDELEGKVNPNGDATQAPVIFTAEMRQGGVTLNQTEIILNCTNVSSNQVEIGDFQSHLWLAGMKSYKCMPANIGSVKIPANTTVSFRMYADAGIVIQEYVNCKKALNKLASGKDTSVMSAGTYIPLAKQPVLLNIQYLWYWKGGETECFVYDVPGSYRWKYAGWVHGVNAGYNAAKEKDQDKNPSYWTNTDKIEE